MQRVIWHNTTARRPVVFAFGNLAPDSTSCTGIEVDIKTQTRNDVPEDGEEGWLCVAAVSDDTAGNHGVSRPLRLCYDNPSVPGKPACATDKSNPPTCTDGCTLPPAFFDDTVIKP